MNKKVIITGMHRSGTSMVTGLLKRCGLYLGDNLLPPMDENRKGFYEDKEFLAINNEILKYNSISWCNVCSDDIIINKFIESKMKDFISKWPKNKIIGFKDPRCCLTLHLWKEIIGRENLKVVFAERNHFDIARSLQIRNGFEIPYSQILIKEYIKRVQQNLNQIHYITTKYENYFNNWYLELSILVNFIGLRIPENHKIITSFIDKNLWNNNKGGIENGD